MNAHLRIHKMRRQALEAKIEELIALLDLLDGDENLESSLADTRPADDAQADLEGDECDGEPNGDEHETGFAEDEWHGLP